MSCRSRGIADPSWETGAGSGLWPIIQQPPFFSVLIDRYMAVEKLGETSGASEVLKALKEICEQRAEDLGLVAQIDDTWGEGSSLPQEVIQVAEMLGEHTQYLGQVTLPNEHRVVHRKYCSLKLETRQCRGDVYVKFTHPDIFDFIDAVKDCAVVAAIAAVLTAVVMENPTVGPAIFKPLWILSMKTKSLEIVARQTSIELWWEKHCTDWS